MEGMAAVAAALLLLAILDDGNRKSKKQDEKSYKSGELFLGREALDDDVYYVYTFTPNFAVLHRGTLEECCEYMRDHTLVE